MKNELLKRIFSSIILMPLVFFLIIKGSYFFYFLLFSTFLICFYEWLSMSKNKSYFFYGFIFLLFSFYCFYKLRITPDNNYINLLLITTICILTDIGGFVFGKIFKGPKLTKYSPNKTYSGVMGSYFLSINLVTFLLIFNLLEIQNITKFIIFIFLISTVSQIGDILISYFKRISKIKDTGKLIPGHGGLLDRVDGMIFAFPFSYLILPTNLLNSI